MRRAALAAIIAGALAVPAFAQSPPAAPPLTPRLHPSSGGPAANPAVPADAGPCSHSGGGVQMSIGGIDLAQVRCQLALWQQYAGALNSELIAVRAAAMLNNSDLKAVQQKATDTAEYWRKYLGLPDAASGNK